MRIFGRIGLFGYLCKTNPKDMKDIICVDLTKLTDSEIAEFCASRNFIYDGVIGLKRQTYAKVWWTREGVGIAFTLAKDNQWNIKDYDSVRMFDGFVPSLSEVPVYEAPKPIVVLDVDSILEKIFKYGKESMTTEEREFLDSQP